MDAVTDSLTVAHISTCGPMTTMCVPIVGSQITPEESTAGDEYIRPKTLAKILDEHFADLAALDVLAYDLRRREIAKILDIRLSTLDFEVAKRRPQTSTPDDADALPAEPKPWELPVEGRQLLNDIVTIIQQVISLRTDQACLVAGWVLFAHCVDCFSHAPILFIQSAAPGCGKSTLMQLLSMLVPRPLAISNISPAALFRCIEAWQPTLLGDEFDSFGKENPELRNVMNAGHQRGTAFVVRCIGEDFKPHRFPVWGAKAIAAIGKVPATIQARSVPIRLERASVGEAQKITRLEVQA